MHKVVETIALTRSWLKNNPEQWLRLGEGLLVLFDPAEVPDDPRLDGREVRIKTPAGAQTSRRVARSVKGASVGLFFSGMSEDTIPAGSEISW